jgi:hypothetical protein
MSTARRAEQARAAEDRMGEITQSEIDRKV